MNEIVAHLEYIGIDQDFPVLNYQAKLDIFSDIRQSFGCSALVLYGGATFGMSKDCDFSDFL